MDKTVESIIDPPVGPYSDYKEISDWIDKLNDMEKTPNVIAALEQAKSWLRIHPDAK